VTKLANIMQELSMKVAERGKGDEQIFNLQFQ